MSTPELIQTAIPLPAQTDENSSNNGKVVAIKRPSRVECEQDREAFFRALQIFHESRNTPITRLPKINGQEVDLYLLYNEVISRGGWLKVNIRNEWDELVGSVGFQQRCVNAAVAIKNIYSRFLDKYERLHFLGEDPDKNDDLDDDGRPKKWTSKTYNSIPMIYNYKQHELTEEQRVINRLSTDLHSASEYDRLLLSLISPLPNEQDFAINVCTLMSNESKHTLKLDHCPKLLDALLAHAGVFCHYTMRELFQELYTKVRRHSLQSFWKDLLHEKPQILEISLDDCYETPDAKYGESGSNRAAALIRKPNFDDGLNSQDDNVEKIDLNTLGFLALGRGLGTQEYIGQRVHQITSILRNLSFYDENVPVLAKNRTFIRFLVMGANIRWGNLHHMALDVFGNIATELSLYDPTVDDLTRCLMSTVCEGIESPDRGVIISCLEVLYKVCQQDSNEDHVHRCLNQRLYNTLCLYLSLNDIMLLLYTLEAIYALSSLGHKACNSLVQVKGVINSLMSLITVEAQSYGPDGCILMRVVETVPGNMLPMVAQNIANIANLQNAIHTQQPSHMQDQSQTAQGGQGSSRAAQDATSQQGTKSPNNSQEHEQFALSWLSATFELTSTSDSRVEQQELYRMYLSATQKCGRRGIVSHMQFPRIVRTIFGANVGPTVVKKGDGSTDNKVYYVCIRVRANPLPIQMKVLSPQKGAKDGKQKGDLGSIKKTKKRLKLQEQIKQEQQPKMPTLATNGSNLQSQIVPKVEEATQHQMTAVVQSQQPQVVQQTLPTGIVKNENQGNLNPKGPLPTQPSKNATVSQPQMIGCVQVTHTSQTPNVQQPAQPMKTATVSEHSTSVVQQQQVQNPTGNPSQQLQQVITTQQVINVTPTTTGNGGNGGSQPSSSLIKSLLATKVTSSSTASAHTTTNTSATTNANTSAAVVIDTNASAAPNTPQSCLITQNVNLHQVAQRQQKQKELAAQQQHHQNSPIKLSSTSISALVNNPLIQTTPMKVGQTTIKPIGNSASNNANNQEKRTVIISSENSDNSNWDPIPPLAPLSSGALVRSNVILQQQVLSANDDSSSASVASSIISSSQIEGDGSFASFEGLLMSKTNKSVSTFIIEDDSSKDSLSRGSRDSGRQVIIANQMLVDLLDKKSPDPPITGKRKHDDDSDESEGKKILLEVEPKVTASKNAANLYAEMAASILEDEDMEDEPPATMVQQTKLAIQNAPQHHETQSQMISVPVNMQRQLIVNPNNPHQVILSQGTPQSNIPTATATIKTDQGLQTLPVILQKNAMGQQILQPVMQQQQPPPQQTQYVLATNPQGQTYLVAQQTQPQQQTQRLLVTQTPQQQVAGTKTIIILQQQGVPPHSQQQMITTSQPQKVIMTTPQGQQMIVTQMPRPVQQQFYMNSTGTNIIQTGPIQSHIQMPAQQQIMQKQMQNQQQGPNILSQLSHIPATIKIHQSPAPIITASSSQMTTTTATTTSLPRLGKSVSIVQQQGVPPPQTQVTPTVMQAQIVQHTGTPGGSEKRQVIITGGRTIELADSGPQGQIVRMVQPAQQKQQKQTLPVQKPVMRQTQISVATQQSHATITSTTTQLSTQTTASITNQAPVPACSTGQAAVKTPTPPPQPPAVAPSTPTPASVHIAPKAALKTKPEIKPEIKPDVKPEIKVEPKPEKIEDETPVDLNWLFVCDWRNCPRKKFKSITDLHHHSCLVHCPDHLDVGAEIFCQWGPGPGLCDGIPRKRFSLMTHILDRHLTIESLKAAVQRRLSGGPLPPNNGQPVTIIKNAAAVAAQQQAAESARGTASPALSTSSNGSMPSTGSAAMHAIKRHSSDFVNPKELMYPDFANLHSVESTANTASSNTNPASNTTRTTTTINSTPGLDAFAKAMQYNSVLTVSEGDENEGPVTKSIRLTAALILRNLVTYTPAAKRILRQYEPHLASVALSNVESSGTISQILFELNN